MTCERYWREGVVLYEHGEIDPHLESCVDCQQAHAVCAQMIEALPHVGDDVVGNPSWQALVLERIDAIENPAAEHDSGRDAPQLRVVAGGKLVAPEEPRDKARPPVDKFVSRSAPSKWSWWLGGAFAGACAIVCVWLVVGHKPDLDDIHYGITKTESGVTRRSATRMGEPRETDLGSKRSANIEDAVTITVRPTEEIRVYRADSLVLRCPTLNPRCVTDERSVVAHAVFETAGEYQVVVIKPPAGAPKPIAEPVGKLDNDLSAVVSAGGDYEETDYTVM